MQTLQKRQNKLLLKGLHFRGTISDFKHVHTSKWTSKLIVSLHGLCTAIVQIAFWVCYSETMIVEMKIINEKWQICFSNDFFSHSIGSIFYKLFLSQAAPWIVLCCSVTMLMVLSDLNWSTASATTYWINLHIGSINSYF